MPLYHRKLSAKRHRKGTAPGAQSRCFTLEINGQPALVMIAASLQAACRRVSEQWLLEELAGMRSGGAALLRSCDTCRVRSAKADEIAKLQLERLLDEMDGEDTKYAFTFLIPIDTRPN